MSTLGNAGFPACSIYHAVKRKHSLYKPGFKWADLEWFALNQP